MSDVQVTTIATRSIATRPIATRSIGAEIPANAIQQRDGSYILDRAGNYIEVRA